MRILFLTRYTRPGASSRLRFYQYFPIFEEEMYQCKVSPLFDDKYLTKLYSGESISPFYVLWRYLLRGMKLFTYRKYDLLVVEKELFPYLPAVFERLLRILDVKYVVDYDDAIFHNYDLHPSPLVKKLLGNKIAAVMKHAALVVSGNSYLNAYAVKAGAEKTAIIPTVIDTDAYKLKQENDTSEVIIGWIGSPSTLKYVRDIKPVLEKLRERHNVRLHIVGGKSGVGLGAMEEVLEWSEAGEVDMIRQFDIGIMPLQDQLWEYGKCGYKLIQYMGCGIPVVGSPIGVNDAIIQEGVNGFKPSSETKWEEALQKLIINKQLRNEMGIAGREIVEERYSLRKAGKKWLSFFDELIQQGNRS